MSSSFNRREFLALTASASLSLKAAGGNPLISLYRSDAESPRPSSGQEPLHWVREGIVAASNMEALSFVRRRGGELQDYAEQWRADLSDATVRTLLEQGVNLILITLHKGAGLKTEAEDIATAREFVKVAHRRGLRVGGYVGATIFYETLEAEEPQSKDWKQIDEFGHPLYYTPAQTFRYMACRNNPGYMDYIKRVLKVGVLDLQMDMIHFDQLMWWSAPASCHCQHCRRQFRDFLKDRYPAKLALARFGFENVELMDIPPFGSDSIRFAEVANPLIQEWAWFRAWSLAKRYQELSDYIHQLNPGTAVQGNPTMNLDNNVGFLYGVDYGQLLEGGDMVCSEEPNQPLWTDDGRLVSQIRTYKGARTMGKSLWVWQACPRGDKNFPIYDGAMELNISEALAYNDRNLGIVAGFDVLSNTVPREVKPYIDLFTKRSQDLVNTKTVADVAVLRSYASTSFNPAHSNVSTVLVEQSLILDKIPFAIIFDRHLRNLSAYKVLVLADQDALSDSQLAGIRDFVKAGGSVVATGRTSLLNEWRLTRPKFGLSDVLGIDQPAPDQEAGGTPRRTEFGAGRAVYIPRIEPAVEPPPAQVAYAFGNHYWHLPRNHEDLIASIRWAARDQLSAEVKAPRWVTIELAQQGGGLLLLHLVNYKPKETVQNIQATIRPPAKFRVKEASLVTPEHISGQKLTLESGPGNVSMVIPSMRVYALITMSLEAI